ncbi:polynucleotide 5'-hydroxyl-kinase NOL9 [Chironomus tepperi]|uniref:polynucleotide 5'-hydroxyl-kinase NOL9 n=1 Tax=Chironomus tepperi TaxID=113505 RepID=UPI00391F3218
MPRISQENVINGLKTKPLKRKKSPCPTREPISKKTKQESESEDEEDYNDRFKYVLAPKNRPATPQNNTSSDEENSNAETPPKRKKKTKKTSKLDENKNSKKTIDDSRTLNGKQKKSNGISKKTNGISKKIKQMEKYIYDDELDSDDSYLTEDLESFSGDEEGSEEEWTTDTDYTPHSFHESDCESIGSNSESDCESIEDESESGSEDGDGCDYFEDGSSDDEDYVPPIEDKYVKKGEAIMYDGKGLNLAFGDSTESQILDLSEVSAAIIDEDEAPKLIPINEDDITFDNQKSDDNGQNITPNISNAEETLKNLSLDDDETVQSSQLLQRASFYNCSDNHGVIVKLNRTIHFHGILVIKPLVNNVQVNGYILQTNESLKATSISRTDYFLNLTPIIVENQNIDRNELHEELKNLLQTETDAVDILNNLNLEKDTVLHLQLGLPDARVNMLQTYLSDPILPHKNMILKNSVCPTSELQLATKFFVSDENRKLSAFKINFDWDHIELKSSIRLMIIGGKNVGKSAMCQYLINRNISKYPKILLIDLDIGQPIHAPSQTLSATLITEPLIGAGYLNNATIVKCFLFGDKSMMISPFKYIERVMKLMEFCNANEEYKNIPWIINTMGYQKGFGMQLMVLLLRIIQPSEIVQIQHSNMKFNFKSIMKESFVNDFTFTFFDESYLQKFPREVKYTTHVLDSIVNNNAQQGNDGREWTSNATEKRKISMIAQLSKLMKGGQTYLNDVVPFGTSLDNIRLIVMEEEYEQHDNEVNLDLFNGNLVYLCHCENNETLGINSILECYGIGIVRAIDKVHNYVYILLPQQDNSEKLQAMINVLAVGNIPLPPEILLKQNFGVNGTVPYVTFVKDQSISKRKYINKRNIKDSF